MHAPAAMEALRKQGFDPVDSGPDQFAAFIASEFTRWSEVAQAAGSQDLTDPAISRRVASSGHGRCQAAGITGSSR